MSVSGRDMKILEAVEYTQRVDDGAHCGEWQEADLILLGVSRSGKTPLAMFLASKGYKVANFPLVQGLEIPQELYDFDQSRVVALVLDPDVLVAIRKKRAAQMGLNERSATYVDIEVRSGRLVHSAAALLLHAGGRHAQHRIPTPVVCPSVQPIACCRLHVGGLQPRRLLCGPTPQCAPAALHGWSSTRSVPGAASVGMATRPTCAMPPGQQRFPQCCQLRCSSRHHTSHRGSSGANMSCHDMHGCTYPPGSTVQATRPSPRHASTSGQLASSALTTGAVPACRGSRRSCSG
jgi:hypothetical protein